MRIVTKRILRVSAFLFVFVIGTYVGGMILFYSYAYPVILKQELVQEYGWGTPLYYENYRYEMSKPLERLYLAALWPYFVFERDIDLDSSRDRSAS